MGMYNGQWINAVGIRYDDRVFAVGDEVPRSYRWNGDEITDILAPGTSVISLGYDIDEEGLIDAPNDWTPLSAVTEIARREDLQGYVRGYAHAYVVVGREVELGEDDHEVLIQDATVVAVLW